MLAPLRVFRCHSRLYQMTIQTTVGINKNNSLEGGERPIADPSPPPLQQQTGPGLKPKVPTANGRSEPVGLLPSVFVQTNSHIGMGCDRNSNQP